LRRKKGRSESHRRRGGRRGFFAPGGILLSKKKKKWNQQAPPPAIQGGKEEKLHRKGLSPVSRMFGKKKKKRKRPGGLRNTKGRGKVKMIKTIGENTRPPARGGEKRGTSPRSL